MSLFKKILLGLWVSSFFGWLEWGKMSEFVAEIEYGLLFTEGTSIDAFLHPLVLLPLLGQVALVVLLFMPKPKFSMAITATIGLALLYLLIFLAGILSLNIKIMASALPFLAFYFYLIIKGKRISLG